MQSTRDYRLDPLTLLVSLDSEGTASGRLYEDRWEGYGYRRGEYLITDYRAEREGGTLSVGVERRRGMMQPPDRPLLIVLFTDEKVYRGSGRDGETVTFDLD